MQTCVTFSPIIVTKTESCLLTGCTATLFYRFFCTFAAMINSKPRPFAPPSYDSHSQIQLKWPLSRTSFAIKTNWLQRKLRRDEKICTEPTSQIAELPRVSRRPDVPVKTERVTQSYCSALSRPGYKMTSVALPGGFSAAVPKQCLSRAHCARLRAN